MMKQKRILKISSIDSDVFIGELARRLADSKFDVWRYHITSGKLYHYNLNKNYSLKKTGSSSVLRMARTIKNSYLVARYLNNVDFIHYHYIDSNVPLVLPFLRILRPSKVIATFWGSDFYKSRLCILKMKLFSLGSSSTITFTNAQTEQAFLEVFANRAGHTKTIRFGLGPLAYIKQEQTNFNEVKIRRRLGFPLGKWIVAIGTNSSLNQNHIDIIKALSTLSQKQKELFYFIVPLGYPSVSAEYEALLMETFKKAGATEYLLDKQFYTQEDLANFRLSIDIQIQVQSSDQFSGAMQEALAAGSYVITGNWLPYDLLDKRGVRWTKVDSVDQVGNSLMRCIEKPLTAEDKKINRDIIYDLSHWNRVMEDWKQLYI